MAFNRLSWLLVVALLAGTATGQSTVACSDFTMSGSCSCGTDSATGLGSVVFVSCAYMQIPTFPLRVPNTTQQLILSGNQLSRFFGSDLAALTSLQVLDLRRNNITLLVPGSLATLTQLRTLSLDTNLITNIPANVFNIPNSQLRSLYLGSNLITLIPDFAFASLTLLVDLHLENNRLSALTTNMLRGMSQLAFLALHRNQLTALPSGLFADQPGLTTLRLDLNNFRVIPSGTFSSFRNLTTLGMAGNPSFCLISRNVTTCFCTQGYVGSSSPATFCQPIDCGPTIANLDPNATTVCTNNTRFLGTPCVATCNAGYTGNATFTCSALGAWTGSLKCNPRSCGAVIPMLDPNATANCTGPNVVDGAPCTATCKAGFIGGSTQYVCGTNGSWVGALRCSPQDCGRNISGLDTNAASNCTSTTFTSTCRASCNDGFVGGPATYTCGADGIWRGFISCVGRDCGRTLTTTNGLHPNATARCRGDTTFGGKSCPGVCNVGFNGSQFEFICQKTGVWTPRAGSMACDRVICGPNNITIENATYTCPNFRYTDTCTVSCLPGYRTASMVYTCAADATWRGNLTCPPIDCGSVAPLLDPMSTAQCQGSLYDRNASVRGACAASCKPGYELIPGAVASPNLFNGTVTYACMTTGWVGPDGAATPYCRRINCSSHPATLNTSVYNVSCTGTLFESSCSIRCADGLVPAGLAFGATCMADSTWLGDYACMAAELAPAVAVSSSSSLPIIAGVVAGIVLLLLLLLLLLVVIRRRRERATSAPAPARPPKTTAPAKPKRSQIADVMREEQGPVTTIGTLTDNPLHPTYVGRGGAPIPVVQAHSEVFYESTMN